MEEIKNQNQETKPEETKKDKNKPDEPMTLEKFRDETVNETKELSEYVSSKAKNGKLKYSYILAHLNVTKVMVNDLKEGSNLDIHDESKKFVKFADRLISKIANQLTNGK